MKLTFKNLFVVALVLIVLFGAQPTLHAQNSAWMMRPAEPKYAGVLLMTIPPFFYVFAGFAAGFFLGVVFFFRSKAAPAHVLPKSLISLSFRHVLSSVRQGALSQNITLVVTSADTEDPAGKRGEREVIFMVTSKDAPFDKVRITKISNGNKPAAAPAGGAANICKVQTNDTGQVDVTIAPEDAVHLLLVAVDIATGETAVAEIAPY